MRAVLGIDSAWTAKQPSGVALCVERGRAWRCVAVAPSYADFVALAEGREVDWGRPRIAGGAPDPGRILRAAGALAPRARIQAVALDLPLARVPIAGRRAADQAVSREFGARKCSTYTASRERPGRISTVTRDGFEAAGFRLATVRPARGPAILEVYPHTALLSLVPAEERVPYKVSKSRRYWPEASPEVRRRRLLERWRPILASLRRHIAVDLDLPASFATFSSMKRYEDAVDALICAWVAVLFLAGNARPLGDETAAIWTPR
jgi:predicted RNase H-like nuclease